MLMRRASSPDPLASFRPEVREWFGAAFASPTEAQAKAWPAICSGAHVLIAAPTGSGKTLAAFLWALDRLAGDSPTGQVRPESPTGQVRPESPAGQVRCEPPEAQVRHGHTRLVYVSPLKALSYDIERNLRTPLRGIGASGVQVAIRTGDTPQRERAAMARNPPDILITTPESLYLILTSAAREMLRGVEAVIVDEIHAVAQSKRGAHLALTLERLEAMAGPPGGFQRIGLSATQTPLEEVARFLVGPRRRCEIIDAGVRKPLDLRIQVPVESMAQPGPNVADPLAPLPGGESSSNSIWPAIYPQLLELVREHRSSILFVNSRRSAERLALRLNELAGSVLARAHHGSLSAEERSGVEELLKAGEIPCIVATSSLELGIDMGAVDLVLQVESPKSVAAGLQRIGRAGHGVGQVSKGRVFPKFRGDLLECAVLVRLMREGRIEPTVVVRNALDVLAQQIVAIACCGEDVSVDELYGLITRTYSYAELPRTLFENVLDMLDGRYPSHEFGDLRPRIVWDRVAGVIRARKGSRQLAVTSGGTIPDRGLFLVTLPDGRRVGEFDEEMVYEARPGQVFLLGASSWRIEEIGRDRVIVTPAPGVPGAVPFWKGDGLGRPKELGEAIGAFVRWAVDQDEEVLQREYDLDERAASNLLTYLREQQQATGVLPSDRTIVVERFRDEIGDWRLCVLSPFGGRVHAAWGLALSARIRESHGLEADAISSDDGIVVHLPDLGSDGSDEPPSAAELVAIEPEEMEEALMRELGGSALFGARFRESAARALLIPRAYPGKRAPLWQQRLKAQSLLEVARRYEDFPIVLETYRECLRDVLDVAGLRDLLGRLQRRELGLVEVETPVASPFASSLLFDYVATYMYEGDTPNAERKAAALSLDRGLLRELLGSEELRELIDPQALEQLEEDLQRRSARTQVAGADELHDVLRQLGDLSAAELALRVFDGVDAAELVDSLVRDRRVIAIRIAGEERFLAADEAGLYRDALGVAPPGGLPSSFMAEVPDALLKLVKRFALTHGPFTTAQANARWGVDLLALLRELEREGMLVRGELRPEPREGANEREWCEVQVLRRLRRASVAALRKEVEPADQRAFAAFMPSWQGVDRWAGASSGAGIERLREELVSLQGLALTPATWERDVLPRRVGAYSSAWMDELCARGELVWIGAGAVGRNDGRIALYFREDIQMIGPPPVKGEPPSGSEHELLRARLQAGACFFSDLLLDCELPVQALHEALWDLVWAGQVTNDAFAPLRAPRLALARAAGSSGRRFSSRRSLASARSASHPPGRWSSTCALFRQPPEPAARRRAQAELLLERYGVLTREQVLAEGVTGGFAGIYQDLLNLEMLGIARRGYFVEGLGGAQFALPGAVERLRSLRNERSGAKGSSSTLVIAATDPAQPYGAALPWPRDPEGDARRPARVPGAHVVLVDAEPLLYLERGGRRLLTLPAARDSPAALRLALGALADAVRSKRVAKLALERIDGDPVMGSALEPDLIELGFSAGPRRLTLGA
jgi:ATP-dependent helicase Lhr and Lhr-like helicase